MSWDFIVTGWRRSGTTMFVSLLNDHPQVTCDNDSFNYFFARDAYFDFVRSGRPPPPREGERVGLKVLDPFLVPDWKHPRILRRAARDGMLDAVPDRREFSDMIEGFTRRLASSRPRVLNLVRHALHVYVSEQIALQRREFKYRSAFQERFRHVFDIDDFERWFAAKRDVQRRVAFLKPEDCTLTIFYEDLMSPEHREATLAAVFRHIGVVPVPVEAKTRKQLPNALRDSVVNYDDMIGDLKRANLGFIAGGL
jgi:hypothetical protein